jgi:hypothetical protein
MTTRLDQLPPGRRWIGGDPGSTGNEVLYRQTIKTKIPSGTQRRDYVECVFNWEGNQDFVMLGGGYKNLRFLGCKLVGCRPIPAQNNAPKFFYIHVPDEDEDVGSNLVWDGTEVVNSRSEGFAEFKCAGWTVANTKYTNTNVTRQDIWCRWGKGGLVYNNPDFDHATVRGHGHAFVDCPKMKVTLYAGNLPAVKREWQPLAVPGGMNNQHSSAECYVRGCRSVTVGTLNKLPLMSPDGKTRGQVYPSRDHAIEDGIPVEFERDAYTNIRRFPGPPEVMQRLPGVV